MSDLEIDSGVSEVETEIVVMRDDFTMAITNTETGEIVGIEDAPSSDTAETSDDVRAVIEWVGMRRTKVNAKLQGLQAEKAEWTSRIDKQYAVQIRHLERFVQYLDTVYEPMLREYAKRALAGQKAKTLKIAFLELSFGTTRARTDVVDNDKAVAYCEKNKLTEVIKIAKSILKSAIPESIKIKLTADKQGETGIFFYPGGEETFTIK